MKRLAIAFIVIVAVGSAEAQEGSTSSGQERSAVLQSLENELKRLGTDTALLVPSQAVDEFPVWSPDGSRLAANLAGVWYTVNVDHLALAGATWRGDLLIGVLASNESVAEAPEAAAWKDAANMAPRAIKTGGGTKLELRQEGMSTTFVLEAPASEPQALWRSDFENCHSLSVSPDEKFVAFICELNGVIVFRVNNRDGGGGA